jgi:hypothetical protein
MRKCSFPNCDHLGDIITNYHCESVHGMTKKEVMHTYGEPIEVKGKLIKSYYPKESFSWQERDTRDKKYKKMYL